MTEFITSKIITIIVIIIILKGHLSGRNTRWIYLANPKSAIFKIELLSFVVRRRFCSKKWYTLRMNWNAEKTFMHLQNYNISNNSFISLNIILPLLIIIRENQRTCNPSNWQFSSLLQCCWTIYSTKLNQYPTYKFQLFMALSTMKK